MNDFCCHGALFLWQLQHSMNMGCLSNTVAMATFMRFLLKLSDYSPAIALSEEKDKLVTEDLRDRKRKK